MVTLTLALPEYSSFSKKVVLFQRDPQHQWWGAGRGTALSGPRSSLVLNLFFCLLSFQGVGYTRPHPKGECLMGNSFC